LTDDDVWDVLKVADWGIAQLLNEHSATLSGVTTTYPTPDQFDLAGVGAALGISGTTLIFKLEIE